MATYEPTFGPAVSGLQVEPRARSVSVIERVDGHEPQMGKANLFSAPVAENRRLNLRTRLNAAVALGCSPSVGWPRALRRRVPGEADHEDGDR